MTEYDPERLKEQLERLLGPALPDQATDNIHAALELAELLETRGYDFSLKDLCPGSLDDSQWRATFTKGETKFALEDSRAAVAVCAAALDALKSA